MLKMTSVEAQNHFGLLLDTAQRETVVITRHGRPTAYVLSPQEMDALLHSQQDGSKHLSEPRTLIEADATKPAPSRTSKKPARATNPRQAAKPSTAEPEPSPADSNNGAWFL